MLKGINVSANTAVAIFRAGSWLYIRPPKRPTKHISLKMAIAMFARMLDNFSTFYVAQAEEEVLHVPDSSLEQRYYVVWNYSLGLYQLSECFLFIQKLVLLLYSGDQWKNRTLKEKHCVLSGNMKMEI
jgi:hypothetical protein